MSTHDSWIEIANLVSKQQVVTARGLSFHELLNARLTFLNPTRNYINPYYRSLNLPFALANFVDIMVGVNPGISIYFNSRIKEFLNEQHTFDGSYGSRMYGITSSGQSLYGNQFVRCYEQLKRDPYTRQAVMIFHNPAFENYEGKDIACTLSLQFIYRDGKLNLITTMRSNDVYLGFCYDTMAFQMMQLTMASLLDFNVGEYIHNVASLHLYVTDISKLQHLRHDPIYEKYSSLNPDFTSIESFLRDMNLVCLSVSDDINMYEKISSKYARNILASLLCGIGLKQRKDMTLTSLAITNEWRHYFARRSDKNEP